MALTLVIISPQLRTKLTSSLRTERQDVISEKDLPAFKLQIPEDVIAKFDSAYSLYSEDDAGKLESPLSKHLKKHNKWSSATLDYENESYNIKVKIHGKSPSQHIEGNHYSLGIKLLDGKQINGVSRFNLIVYWRIRSNYDVAIHLAKTADLLYLEDILSVVSINDRAPKLYFFEYRLQDGYLNKLDNKNLTYLKTKCRSAAVYSTGNIDTCNAYVAKSIKMLKLTDSISEALYNTYAELNNAIIEENTDKVLSFFDLDYLARVQAFRYVLGCDGHGFMNDNLMVLLDTNTKIFYPIIYRDHDPRPLDISRLSKKFDGSNLSEYPLLFTVLSKSDLLAEKTKAYLIEMINEERLAPGTIDSIQQEHNSYYYSSSYKQSLGLQPSHPVEENIKLIKQQLLKYSR